MSEDQSYTPAQIVELFTPSRGLQGHEVAMLMSAFWPTIKDALLAYDKATGGAKVAPRSVSLD